MNKKELPVQPIEQKDWNKIKQPRHEGEKAGETYEEMTFANPSPAEIEHAKNEGGIVAKPVKPQVESDPQIGEVPKTTGLEMNPVELKPTSAFEPKSIEFFLTTGNKVIKNPAVTNKGSIFIRRFTTVEESIIQNALLQDAMSDVGLGAQNKAPVTLTDFLFLLNNAINPCIKSQINIKELTIIDKLPLLIKIISLTYGKDIETEFYCESCDKPHKHTIDLEKDIIIKNMPKDFAVPRKIILTDSFDFPVEITVTMPLVEHEPFFMGKDIDILRQFESVVIDATGKLPDGEEIGLKDLSDIIDNLGDGDKTKIKSFIQEYTAFGTDLKLRPFKLCKETNRKKCGLAGKEIEDVKLPLQVLLQNII